MKERKLILIGILLAASWLVVFQTMALKELKPCYFCEGAHL